MQELLELLKPLLEIYGGKLGPVVQFIAFIGSTRLVLKPLQPVWSAIKEYIKGTESQKDDELLAKVESHPAIKWIKFAIDYLLSIKIK